jgi:hypothetical protein
LTGKMYPPGYDKFYELVLQYVTLDVLERVLLYDLKILKQSKLKLSSMVIRLMNQVLSIVGEDIVACRRQLDSMDGKIITKKQEETALMVEFEFKGYTHRISLYNHHLKGQCEKIFEKYLSKINHR